MKQAFSPTPKWLFNRQSIGHRLIVYILIASSLITLLGTGFQLYTDYRRDLGQINERMQQIQTSYLEGIINSIWMADIRQAQVLLKGVVRLPDMRYAHIRTPEGIWLKEGEQVHNQSLTFAFPLKYVHQEEEFDLGELRLTATLENVYARLWDKILIILFTQGVKTFLVSGFILVVVHLMITRHLGTLALYAHETTPENLESPVALQRTAKKDELHEVVVAFNRMRRSLQTYYQQLREELLRRHEAENELVKYQEHLEEQVEARTNQLSSANRQLEDEIHERREAEHQLKASLSEKEVLLEEVNHRVKNNMQIISSMLRLQFRNLKDPGLEIQLNEIQQRIQTMSLVHEKLYQSSTLSRIDLPDFITDLSRELLSSYGISGERVKLHLELASVSLDMSLTIPCGLIINELFINSLKYAFPDETKGEIHIELFREPPGQIRLQFYDNGPGLPPETDWTQSSGMGLRLIHILSRQLRGEYKLRSENGTRFELNFPEKEDEPGTDINS